MGLTAPGLSPSRETCVFWPQLLGVTATQQDPVRLGNMAQSQAGLPGEGCLCLRKPPNGPLRTQLPWVRANGVGHKEGYVRPSPSLSLFFLLF